MLVIVVVNQSIMGRPPLQLKLSARRSQFQPNLRQSLGKSHQSGQKSHAWKGFWPTEVGPT
jgi:hypothetical protein